jgi:hypothetical protein
MARGRNMFVEVLILVKSFLCLSHHWCSHLTRWNNSKNQIYLDGIGDDYVKQNANVIISQHNANSLMKRLNWRWWKDMDLLTQNTKPCIFLQWRWKYLKSHCEVEPSWEMGREIYGHIKGTCEHTKDPKPTIFPKTGMRVK